MEPPTGVEWTLGYVKEYPEHFKGNSTDFGILLQASDRVSDHAKRHAPNSIGTLNVKLQRHMRLSLGYFCCSRQDEMQGVRQAIQTWINQLDTSHIQVHFDRLECWKERDNSITNIIIGDETSQQALLPVYMDLVKQIHEQVPIYDPLVVPRQDQMPFHTTLIGTYYGVGAKGESIDPVLPVLAEITETITRDTFGTGMPPPVRLDFCALSIRVKTTQWTQNVALNTREHTSVTSSHEM